MHPSTSHLVTVKPGQARATRQLRNIDLVVLSIGTFTLGVDGFVLSGLLPQAAGTGGHCSQQAWPSLSSA